MEKTFLALFLLPLQVSCSRPFDLDLPYEGDRLVLNGVLVHGQLIEVNVSRSNAPTGFAPADLSVNHAMVSVYSDDTFLCTLTPFAKGRYASADQRAQKGTKYRIEVVAAGFPSVQASTVVPQGFTLDTVRFRTINSELNPAEIGTEIQAVIADNGLTKDFYSIAVTGLTDGSTEVGRPTRWIPQAVEEMETPCNYERRSVTLYDDRCFNGTIASLAVGVENRASFFNQPFGSRGELRFLMVRLQKISPELFRYHFSNTFIGGIELAFFEPDFLYSNVTNGFGVLGSANEIVIRHEISR